MRGRNFSASMPCPICGCDLSLVADSRVSATLGYIRRRRVCRNEHRFTTHEIAEGELSLLAFDPCI